MTETKTPPTKPAGDMSQLLVDLGPVALFVLTYNVLNKQRPDDAIYWATGVFIAATLAAIAWCHFKRGRIPPVLIVTGVIVTLFGGLTIALHNDAFVQIKPTVLNGFFAVAIAGSLLAGRNVWKLMFQHVFDLPDRIWTILAWRWAGFFAFLALLNEIIRNTMSQDFWVNSKLLIVFPLTFLFAIANTPLIMKNANAEHSGAENQGE